MHRPLSSVTGALKKDISGDFRSGQDDAEKSHPVLCESVYNVPNGAKTSPIPLNLQLPSATHYVTARNQMQTKPGASHCTAIVNRPLE